jgi:hypothetical protein
MGLKRVDANNAWEEPRCAKPLALLHRRRHMNGAILIEPDTIMVASSIRRRVFVGHVCREADLRGISLAAALKGETTAVIARKS